MLVHALPAVRFASGNNGRWEKPLLTLVALGLNVSACEASKLTLACATVEPADAASLREGQRKDPSFAVIALLFPLFPSPPCSVAFVAPVLRDVSSELSGVPHAFHLLEGA